MRIGHCQLESKTGDFEANLGKVVKGLERADKDRVEIVCFPECFLTGYPDREEVVRKSAFAVDSPQMMKLLDRTGRFEATYIVGFNELRGNDLYNTAVVVQKGHILGTYSKCSAYMKFHKQGREFPVFERGGVKFGVIICSDGGYIEPARILALKGARIVFAPHFNYIGAKGLINHFQKVRADHTARAVENDVWFVRGNNVVLDQESGAELRRGRVRGQLRHRPVRGDGGAEPPAPGGLHLRRHRPGGDRQGLGRGPVAVQRPGVRQAPARRYGPPGLTTDRAPYLSRASCGRGRYTRRRE